MKTDELKQILKPFIKSLIKEVLLEEQGVLSHIVKECSQGIKKELLVETKQVVVKEEPTINDREERVQEIQRGLLEKKKRLVESIAKSGYDNLKNVFEGTIPLSKGGAEGTTPAASSPLANIDPNDSGVDLSMFNFKGNR